MKLPIAIFLFLLLAPFACKKKDHGAVTTNANDTIAPADNTPFSCDPLPPAPQPYGWHDTVVNADHAINTFMYNPANPDELIIVVDGDIFGYNKMYCYNVPQGKATYLATIDEFAPSINSRGWVLYNTVDYNVYKVKANGDSVKQITFGNVTRDPRWDQTGNNMYYFQMANGSVPTYIVRANNKGVAFGVVPAFLPHTAVFNKSNKVIYQKIKDNFVQLVVHDMDKGSETNLISGPYSPTAEMYFSHLCTDNNDEYFYWSNSGGLFRCAFSSLKIDTVLKNCARVVYRNPVFQANHPEEILLGFTYLRFVAPFDRFHESKALLYNTATREKNILNVYP